MRRVAKKNSEGKVEKTPAYQDLLERAQRPRVEGCCCNFFFCNISDESWPAFRQVLLVLFIFFFFGRFSFPVP